MNDATVVQIGHAGADVADPPERLVRRQAPRPLVQNGLQIRLGHVLHDDPRVALVVLADVVDVEQVGVFSG